MKKQLLILVAALSFCACSDDSKEFEMTNNLPVFTAETDVPETRTYLGGLNILWNKGDKVAMFLKNYQPIHQYEVTAGEGTTQATLTPTTQQESGETKLNFNYAIYPYNDQIFLSGNKYNPNSNSILLRNIIFNSELLYSDTETCIKYMPMIAVSADDHLQFKNMGAVLKFRVKAGNNELGTYTHLASILIKGFNKEPLSGSAIASYNKQDGSFQSFYFDNQKSIGYTSMVKKQGGFELNETTATDIYIVLPPTNFTKGIEISLLDKHSDDMTLKTKPLNIERNKMYVFPEITFVPFKMGGTLPEIPVEPASL